MILISLKTKPIPWAASRITARGAYNPRVKEKNWHRWAIKNIYKGNPIDGYVVIDFKFYMAIPAATSKKKRAMMLSGEIIPTNCDATNCQKFQEDCLKQIVITDDRNVAKISSEKLYGEIEQVVIKIWTLQEYRNAFGGR